MFDCRQLSAIGFAVLLSGCAVSQKTMRSPASLFDGMAFWEHAHLGEEPYSFYWKGDWFEVWDSTPSGPQHYGVDFSTCKELGPALKELHESLFVSAEMILAAKQNLSDVAVVLDGHTFVLRYYPSGQRSLIEFESYDDLELPWVAKAKIVQRIARDCQNR